MKTIGIIGGMGPEATIDLYSKITKLTSVTKDQEHLHIIIDSYAQIPDRTAFILEKSSDNPANHLIEAAKRLENAGVDVLCMPCNTAHHFLPEVCEHITTPFISITDCTINTLKQMPEHPKKVFVMATTGTKAAKVYETKLEENGFEVLPLPDDIQEQLMCCIYEGVKQGKKKEYLPLFKEVIQYLSADDPHALIAACTELPLLTAHINSPVPIVDATLELAKACATFGKTGKLPN